MCIYISKYVMEINWIIPVSNVKTNTLNVMKECDNADAHHHNELIIFNLKYI